MLTMIIEFKSRSFAPPPRPKKRLVDILSYPHQSGGKLDVVGFVVGFVDGNNVTILIVFCKYLFFYFKAQMYEKNI